MAADDIKDQEQDQRRSSRPILIMAKRAMLQDDTFIFHAPTSGGTICRRRHRQVACMNNYTDKHYHLTTRSRKLTSCAPIPPATLATGASAPCRAAPNTAASASSHVGGPAFAALLTTAAAAATVASSASSSTDGGASTPTPRATAVATRAANAAPSSSSASSPPSVPSASRASKHACSVARRDALVLLASHST